MNLAVRLIVSGGCGTVLSKEDLAIKSRHIAVDVETSGLAAVSGGRVIEIGAVAIEEGRIVAELSTLIQTGTPISYGAFKIHGISREMLRGQPAPDEVWPAFLNFIGNAPLIAHNAPFDTGFIRHELALLGLGLPNPSICTVRLARRCCPQLPNHRLATVARHLLGELPGDCHLHRALDDARLAARIWMAMHNFKK